ncbi:craniofacial development protein 1-like [Gigantopelta aegis]|uniref:craniofacial development protein 1-like n=1 Tax=Gigantopelta aegis TaxID=1735272 RepID=UPI001B88BD7B|nr:craniofacial development protein 1-like [Gigantopelta aegis]
MSDEEDYSSEDDVDYVPSDGEAVSEEEGSGDEEDLSALVQDAAQDKTDGKRRRKTGSIIQRPRKRLGGIKLEGEQVDIIQVDEGNKELAVAIIQEHEAKKEEQEKKRADDLWSSFLSDVKVPPKKSSSPNSLTSVTSPTKTVPDSLVQSQKVSGAQNSEQKGKITVTKMFDFAGEQVKVTKEVDVSSKEGQAELKKQKTTDSVIGSVNTGTSEATKSVLSVGVKRPASSGGLGSILSKIGKKDKISTLEKSKLDWNKFKKEEGIEDEVNLHNKGKQSFLERQAFLNRTDLRQYEIEKSLRLGTSKR